MTRATVDRTYESSEGDSEIVVTLPCGHAERFFITGLSDAEYIRRTEQIKALEEGKVA